MITETNNVFYCDCGFSFQRGQSGSHDCADGLRNKLSELEARCLALAAENAGMKSAIEKHADSYIMCGYCRTERDGKNDDVCEVLDSIPATDAFLVEVRAQGVEAAIDTAKNVVAQEFQYKDFETAQRVCSKFPESDLVGKVEMVEWLADFASHLRKGVQS
ncbi:TPA: hypothetical protein N5O02_001816 [Enterobacter asburiae]|nr:hypothetical protein [Enterobacter asburiae]